MKLLFLVLILIGCSDSDYSRSIKYPDSFWIGTQQIEKDTSSYTTWGYCNKENIEACINDALKDCDLAHIDKTSSGYMINCVKKLKHYCGTVDIPLPREKGIYIDVCCNEHGCFRRN